MQTVNEVFKAGSLNAMIKEKVLKTEKCSECITRSIPFVLAGSIRDDGPIPDVVTDMVEAKHHTETNMKNVKMVLMFSTMLHSIAAGNMLVCFG